MIETSLLAWFIRTVQFGTIIMFGSLGEILTEKSGNLNLGVPGIMYLGAIASLTGAFFYERAVEVPNPIVCIIIAFVCAFLAAALGGLIFSFLTITLRANQNVTGLALTTFGVGFGNFFGGSLVKLTGADMPFLALSATSNCFKKSLPFADKLGIIGDLFFGYSFLVYLALAIALELSLEDTRDLLDAIDQIDGESGAEAPAAEEE